MPKKNLKISLFDPGMTDLHRVGLAGLYMSLSRLKDKYKSLKGAHCIFNEKYVKIDFEDEYSFFEWLFEESFKIDQMNLIDFEILKSVDIGDIEKTTYHRCVLDTFLQHPKTTDKEKQIERNLDMGDRQVVISYKPLKWYYLQGKRPPWKIKSTSPALEMIFSKNGELNDNIKIKGLHLPGAVERHSGLKNTEMVQTPEQIVCLLYAPSATLYYQLFHKNPDGKMDRKLRNALVLPHIIDLEKYSKNFMEWLRTPVHRLTVNNLGDAALTSLIELKSHRDLKTLGVSGCTVISLGIAKWSENQKTRTKVFEIKNPSIKMLELFDTAWRCFPNKTIFIEKSKKKNTKRMFVTTSTCRGFIAENVASGKDWFFNFHQLMKTQTAAERIKFEGRGLAEMVENAEWKYESDRILVESIHRAIRNRFGEMAARAKEKGEQIQFDRERERIRSSLMRAKNLQTLRAELADIFARGGVNKVLQKNWTELLPLFTGPDWQRARDLGLLALASYTSAKGDEDLNEKNEGK